MESHKRTFVKTITWRIIAFFTGMITIYFFTGSFSIALSSAIVANLLKTGMYYVHERVWNKSNYGRKICVEKKRKK